MLTEEQCEQYQHDGYLVLRSQFDENERALPASARLRRESRFCGSFTRQDDGDKTRCATSGTLPSHAVAVTQRSEALGTM